MAPEQTIEMDPVDLGRPRCGPDVAAVRRQNLLEIPALEGPDPAFPRNFERQLGRHPRRGDRFVMTLGRWRLAREQTPLDVVAELADVSRPGVAGEIVQERGGVQARLRQSIASL